jgi:hypothetical protein
MNSKALETVDRSETSSIHSPRPRPIITMVVWGLVAFGILFSLYRAVDGYQVPGPFDQHNVGFCDFHNGVYFPTLAWLRGENPYSQQYADSYPVMRQVPLFSPLVFLVHLPLALLPLTIAEGVNFALIVAMAIGCAMVLYRGWTAAGGNLALSRSLGVGLLTLAIVFSRAGHTTLISGYFSLELALATLVVFMAADRQSWIASLALAYTSIKPTYAIPLGIVLLAMGRFGVVVRGTTAAILLGVATLGWTVIHADAGPGIGAKIVSTLEQIGGTQDVHRSQNWEKPAVSWTRIDLFGVIAKWMRAEPGDLAHLAFMLVFLIPICPVLWKARVAAQSTGDAGLLGMTTGLAIVAMTVGLYRHAYDAVPLLAPLLGAAVGAWNWRRVSLKIRVLLIVLLGLPLANYASTNLVLGRVPLPPRIVDVVTSLNGVALTAATVILVGLVWNCAIERAAGDKQRNLA